MLIVLSPVCLSKIVKITYLHYYSFLSYSSLVLLWLGWTHVLSFISLIVFHIPVGTFILCWHQWKHSLYHVSLISSTNFITWLLLMVMPTVLSQIGFCVFFCMLLKLFLGGPSFVHIKKFEKWSKQCDSYYYWFPHVAVNICQVRHLHKWLSSHYFFLVELFL